jgi:tetratricopeptide (TPR) repeat protein
MMNIPLAWVFIIKNKFNEAIKTLKKTPKKLLLSQKGYSPWAIALANLAIESGDKTLVEEALKKFKLANLDDSQSDYLHSTAGKMLLQFGKNQIDKKMFSQGTNEMEKAISLNPENPIHYADLARHKLSLAIINGNESLADNAIHLFQTASILSPLNPHILQLWGYSISFSNLIFDRDPSKDKMFFEKINAFESSERLEYWKTFAKNATIYLLENLMQIFQRDFDEFPETMSSVVAEWVINILSEPHKNLSLNQIITLNELISKLSLLVPELGILKTYIDIYDCIIIKEDQSALFTLSKEQREFFEKYILDRRLGGAKQSNNPLLHFFNS